MKRSTTGLPATAIRTNSCELTRRTQIRSGDQNRPLVLFETAFGRTHRATGAFIDFLIWIDTPLDIALSRASLIFLESRQRDGAPNAAADFLAWLTRYMQGYPMLRTTYLALRERLAATADLVIDGSGSVETSVDTVRKALAARGVAPSAALSSKA
jgi:hypothetical protein